jgi:hypothetical protein
MTPQAQHFAAVAEEMLLDAGLAQDAELYRALLSVGQLADLPVPVPSGQLAALLGEPGQPPSGDRFSHRRDDAATSPGDELGRRRRLRSHRPTVVGLALVAGMGMGVGTVAASPAGSAPTGSLSIQQMLEDWAPSWAIHMPQATTPGFLQQDHDGGYDVPVQRDAGQAGSEASLAGDSPSALQRRPSSQAPAPQAPGEVRNGSGEPSSANGQGGAKEAEKTGGTAGNGGADAAPADGTGQRSGNAPDAADEEPGPGPGPASGVEKESGQPPAVEDGADSTVARGMPGAKWLEKFTR